MASFNKVLLMGNLTRDPELTYTPNQVAVCKFGLAVNKKYRAKSGEEREDVLFIDCTAFDKKGEAIHQYCVKGNPLFVEGQLKLDTWDDRQTGQKRSKIHVVVDNFQFLGARGAPGDDGDQRPEPRQAPRPAPGRPAPGRPAASHPQGQPFSDEQHFKENDIPF